MPLEEMDVALIDLGDPWSVIPKVSQMLKGSGSVFCHLPNYESIGEIDYSVS